MKARLKITKQKGNAYDSIVVLGKKFVTSPGYVFFVTKNIKNGITVSKVNKNKLEFYTKSTDSWK